MLQDSNPHDPSASEDPASNSRGGSTGTSRVSSGGSSIPAISLLKGGGAIRGIGEKFAANPVTGTAALTVPLATSPGRSGFGPQLQLSYDSGAGSGPFGFGWSLSLPTITRKTDKGLPRYWDGDESDVFILSGSEDLVPVLAEANGEWKRETLPTRILDGNNYRVQRYRPRIEGLFARMERWTNLQTNETHWRSITRDNITTLYGKDDNSRIFAPADANQPKREFSWLICQSYDDKGNALVYEYASENDQNVDLAQANERNRTRTANRYLKRVKYGNKVSRLVQPNLSPMDWMFEVVFDYEEGHYENVPLNPLLNEAEQHRFVRASASAATSWSVRPDPFSSYRAGFEVRTYRRCQRVLMFHHFDELAPEPYLVRSTEFEYADFNYSLPISIEDQLAHQGSSRFGSFIHSVTQSGFVRDDTQALIERDGVQYATYLKKSLPPLELEYSKANIQEDIRELDEVSLENLPMGLDGSTYQWVDLDGEGICGILTDQADTWFYKPNLGNGHFGPFQALPLKPSLANLGGGSQQLIDLAGDGQLDLVTFAGPTPGFYERTQDDDWERFRTFRYLPNVRWNDPNLRFVDLTGDGHADVLITEDEVLTWYPSLAEEGFDSSEFVRKPLDEERGPRLVMADGTQSIYLGDMCGDGLTALVRIRNGEVCYWPSLGYGRFGAKVTMDDAPQFDNPDQFENRRIRLADIDGSGTNDIIYLARDGVRLYFNQSGNRWSKPRSLRTFPHVDNLSAVMTVDLLGNGTACLVWSSPLPADHGRQVRYIDLMGGQKPHLLVKSLNNFGAETHVHYGSSTKFYLEDKAAGTPWITKLPFPVHVVERVETYDRISGNRFVTRYGYHHGYFDGIEREFRGFGMVEQRDTEEFAVLNASQDFPVGTNVDESSHVPPVLTRNWFHTGVFLGRDHVSDFFAGTIDPNDVGEYYREPGLTDAQARELLLDDTVLPVGLTVAEEREACRALKGSMLRQEVYALDGTAKEKIPYTVTEQNFTVRRFQPQGANRHAVFFIHSRESLSYHYERDPTDPRVAHTLTLEVDDFGNVLKSAAASYGRRQPDLALELRDQAKQRELHITYMENEVTNGVNDLDDYRAPLPSESRTFELTGMDLLLSQSRFSFDQILDEGTGAAPLSYEVSATPSVLQKRLIENVRTLYRQADLSAPYPLGQVDSLALPFQSYKLAFTPGLLSAVYGGNVTSMILTSEGGYVHSEGDANWWIPTELVFYSPNAADTPQQELDHARHHFFLPHRYRDAFHTDSVSTETFVTFDPYDLLTLEIRDVLGNRSTVGERAINPAQPLVRNGHNYRVLQPELMMDPNRNRTAAAFDALGMVVGTAVMGKPEDNPLLGDQLTAGFVVDLTQGEINQFASDPRGPESSALLGDATTRIIYDLTAYWREPNPQHKQPAFAAIIARETHASDPVPSGGLRVQVSFSYSDGFSREVQKKIQAEAGPVPMRDADGQIILAASGQPSITTTAVRPRWVGTGWTVFNNKGKEVRQYEPFFTDAHRFEFDVRVGVSLILHYDPLERVVAKLHPNQTWEKLQVDAWRQASWDVNDTVLAVDPALDPDVGDSFSRLAASDYLPTWYAQRVGGALGPEEQAAARKSAIHANTPALAHFDSLGRTFLTVTHNKFKRSDAPPNDPPTEEFYPTRVNFDIEGNQREVIDALDRRIMRYSYNMLGGRIHQDSADAGERWMLNDIAGEPVRSWDNRGHQFKTEYDALRRPVRHFVRGTDAITSDLRTLNREVLFQQTEYGEGQPNDIALNLRTHVFKQFDGAGVVTNMDLNPGTNLNEAYDFKGNLLRTVRELASDYKSIIDWSDPVPTEESYSSSTTYDAFNRAVTITTPDHSVLRPTFNEANLLNSIEVNLRGEAQNGRPKWTPFVLNIDYDAKGQRELIAYGNGATTQYSYDPLTLHLRDLTTIRPTAQYPDDCAKPAPTGWPGCQIQQLHYAYDPVGNIMSIRDDSQQTIFFRNRRIEPSAEFTYDGIYRLIEASGREHLGQAAQPTAPDKFNGFHSGLDHPGDGNALGTYLEQYFYDGVGNTLAVRHRGSNPVHPGWKRCYQHAIDNNRLLSTGNPNTPHDPDDPCPTPYAATPVYDEKYTYDSHGNVTRMPHLPLIQWDYHDQLQATSQQVVGNGGDPEITWYVYDANGQRARKVTERQAIAGQIPTRLKERIYVGGFEIYRDYDADGATIKLERETVHVIDDKRTVALVETRTDTVGAPQLSRYQFSNHLGSASLELDQHAQVIAYEEYFPYGSTSYQAVRSRIEGPKRHRFSGKERDEESGLDYFGLRYYLPWLGRWISCDPAGLMDGENLFAYVGNNPIVKSDPTGGFGSPPGDGIEDWFNRRKALAMARAGSYAMTAKSNAESKARDVHEAYSIAKGDKTYKRPAVQSVLGGAFLRMYLDHEVDPALVKEAGEEIKQEPEFKKLEKQVESKEEALGKKLLGKDAGKLLLDKAAKHLEYRLKHGGIAFKYETNPIIGGVSGAEIKEVRTTRTKTDKGTRVDYEIDVTFKDTYDFDNKRNGVYDKYRKLLASYLAKGQYDKFWVAYEQEAFGKGVTGLKHPEVFASFMYAIEKKGWTAGPLAWEVVIPLKGSILIPTPPAKKTPAQKKKQKH